MKNLTSKINKMSSEEIETEYHQVKEEILPNSTYLVNKLIKQLEKNFDKPLSEEQLEKNKQIHQEIKQEYSNNINVINEYYRQKNDQESVALSKKLLQDNERNDRISGLLYPSDEREFQQNLMWMTQQGTERDYSLLWKLYQQPFESNAIKFFLKKALEKCRPTFASFQELENAHNNLIAEYRNLERQKISDQLKPKIEVFVYQIQATAIYVADMRERFVMQGFLDYWITRLYRMGHDEVMISLAKYDASALAYRQEQAVQSV